MPADPRPALQTIVEAAELSRAYSERTGDDKQQEAPLLDTGILLLGLTSMAAAVRQLPPHVRALRPRAPWMELGLFEHIDPRRAEFFLVMYPEGTLDRIIRKHVLPVGKAAAQILAEIDKRGLPAPSVAPPAAYQFKVSLAGISPPIWRRLLISNQVTLHKLHAAIQIVGGWWDYHLHMFEIAGTEYGSPDPDGDLDLRFLNDTRHKLNSLHLTPGMSFRYRYDFGDDWEHTVRLEDVLPPEQASSHPVCLDGERSFPPEDCGGPYGYRDLLKILSRPGHPQYTDMREWVGPYFDPKEFDLELVNRRLRSGRRVRG